MQLLNYSPEKIKYEAIISEYTEKYQNYENQLTLIKQYAKSQYSPLLILVSEYHQELSKYRAVLRQTIFNKEERESLVKKENHFLVFEKEQSQKIDTYIKEVTAKIYEKYEPFIRFEKNNKLINEDLPKINADHHNDMSLFLPILTLKQTIIEILTKKNKEEFLELICSNLIDYNLTRLAFDKKVQYTIGKIKFSTTNLKGQRKKGTKEFNKDEAFEIFNLNNYMLEKEELDRIIKLKNSSASPTSPITNFNKYQKKALTEHIITHSIIQDNTNYTINYLRKYENLSIYPKLKLEKNCPYQHIVYDCYKEDINNLLEKQILNAIKKDKEKYLKIFNNNLIKIFNSDTFDTISDIITINNHFISLYIKGENSYNPYLILSCLLTILNTYKWQELEKDELNYAHTYLIKYKKETTALIIYLFSQINLENLKNYNNYNQIFNIIKSIINNNQDKDYLYLLTTKLEELATCLNQTKIDKDLLFNNDYYPFNKINTKNIQLEFEPNMQKFYQEYVKTKVKLPLK